MLKYKVWVEEVYNQEIQIEADSVEGAIKLVREGNGETTQLIFQHSNDVVQVDDEHYNTVYNAGDE